MAISILDTEIAALWDADHRSAAWASFVAGALGAVVAALLFLSAMFTLGGTETSQGGTETSQFEGVLTAGVMVLADIALLVFMVGFAYAVAVGVVDGGAGMSSFGLAPPQHRRRRGPPVPQAKDSRGVLSRPAVRRPCPKVRSRSGHR